MTEPFLPGRFWLVGCGNMAGAMLDGWLALGADRRLITVIRPSGLAVADGVRVLTSLPDDEVPALVMLGVKPQKLDEVAPLLAPALDRETILISILAGVELDALRQRFPAPRTILRAMPNLPVRLGKGVTLLFGDEEARTAGVVVERMMAALGHVEWCDEEGMFRAAGILTGAGPAFLYRFIDALAVAGENLGLSAEQASRLARAMVEGSGAYAAASDETPRQLALRVASPGGTTEAGLAVLDRDRALETLLLKTLEAGRDRSLEMAAAARRRD